MVDLLFLQETKIQEMSSRIVCRLGGRGWGRFLEWRLVDLRGAADAVVVLWENRVLQLLNAEVELLSVSCHFKNYEDG